MSERGPAVDWTPLRPGGSAHSTHRLVVTRTGLVFARSWRTWALTAGGLVFALGLTAAGLVSVLSGSWILGLLVLPCGLFLLVGALLLLFSRAVRFDGGQRSVSIGGRRIAFSDVYAVQLLGERVHEEEAPDFDSYELNLVLKDGTRLNVVDHGNRGQLEREVQQLARLVDCRVLDEKVDGVVIHRRRPD
ncbi:MAG: hypothetical protein SFW67_00655 [Myxococcaceae bacterium]|nr:hypothetical protein [Myxococcaceae bacterium]